MGKTIPGMSGKPAFKGLHSVAHLDRSSEGSDGYPEQHSSVVRPKVFSSWKPAFTFPDLFGAELLFWHPTACKKCNFYGISEMGLMVLGCADNQKLLKELA